MKTILIALGAAALAATGAGAQTAAHGSAAHNPAVKNSAAVHVAAPASGANSFTQDQARGRIAKAGYTSVSKLAKDKNGVWRGTAMKGGKKVPIGLDYKGEVTTR